MAVSGSGSCDAITSINSISTIKAGQSALTDNLHGMTPPSLIADSDKGLIIHLKSKPGGSLSFKPSYYANAIFVSKSRKLLIDWLRSLPVHKRYCLTQVRYDYQQWVGPGYEWNEAAMFALGDLWQELLDQCIFVKETNRIYIRVWDMEHDCWGWWNGMSDEQAVVFEDEDEDDIGDEDKDILEGEDESTVEDEGDGEWIEVEREDDIGCSTMASFRVEERER